MLSPENREDPGDPGSPGGDRHAVWPLLAVATSDLEAMAAGRVRLGDAMLERTMIVDDVIMQLLRQRQPIRSRQHLFALASRFLDRVALAHAKRERRHARAVRTAGALAPRPGRAEAGAAAEAIGAALDGLRRAHPRAYEVLVLRSINDLSLATIAKVLGRGLRTVERDWQRARIFVGTALRRSEDR